MRTLSILVLVTLSAACNKEADKKADGPPSPMVKKLEGLADKGCACKSFECTKKINADVAAFAKSITRVADKDKPPMQAAQARLDGCTAKYNPFLIAYAKLASGVCECKDKACAQRSSAEFKRWIAKFKATKNPIQRGHLPTFAAYGKTAGECFQKHGVAIPQ